MNINTTCNKPTQGYFNNKNMVGCTSKNGSEQRMHLQQNGLKQEYVLNRQPSYVQGSDAMFGIEQQKQSSNVQGVELEEEQEYVLSQQPSYNENNYGSNIGLELEQNFRPSYGQNGNGVTGLGVEHRMHRPPYVQNGSSAPELEHRMHPSLVHNGTLGLGVEHRTHQPSYVRNGSSAPELEKGTHHPSYVHNGTLGLGVEHRMHRPPYVHNGALGHGLEKGTQPSVHNGASGLGVEKGTHPSSVHNGASGHGVELCMDNVCYNTYDGGSLNPKDRDFSYSGFNFGLSTKLQYDPCFINDDIEQSTQPLMSILDPNRVKNNEQCLSTLGPRAGHNGYGDNIPIQNPGLTPAQELVDIDSIMSNRNVKQSRCKNGNVNPIDVFKFKTYNSKECNNFLNPLGTINSEPKQNYREISINRFYDLNINPQVNIYYDGAVNTQLEAKDNFSNPFPYFLSDNSSNTVKGKPIDQFVNVYDNKTNSLLTGPDGQKYKL